MEGANSSRRCCQCLGQGVSSGEALRSAQQVAGRTAEALGEATGGDRDWGQRMLDWTEGLDRSAPRRMQRLHLEGACNDTLKLRETDRCGAFRQAHRHGLGPELHGLS